jgi:hypothetical protein
MCVVPIAWPVLLLNKATFKENRRLPSISFRFFERPRSKDTNCARNCAQSLCLENEVRSERATHSRVCTYRQRRRLERDSSSRWDIRGVPRKCQSHVYLQTRGEVAERLKAAVC